MEYPELPFPERPKSLQHPLTSEINEFDEEILRVVHLHKTLYNATWTTTEPTLSSVSSPSSTDKIIPSDKLEAIPSEYKEQLGGSDAISCKQLSIPQDSKPLIEQDLASLQKKIESMSQQLKDIKSNGKIRSKTGKVKIHRRYQETTQTRFIEEPTKEHLKRLLEECRKWQMKVNHNS